MTTNRFAAAQRIWVAVALGLTFNSLRAADTVRYLSQPTGSQMKMDGTSTIHDWTVIGKIIRGQLEADPSFDADGFPKAPKTIPKVEVVIPVRSLKSQVMIGSAQMDKVMQTHLKMTNHTEIKYVLLDLAGKGNADRAPKMEYDAKGALTIAGVTKTNTMPVSFERVDPKTIKIKGHTAVKMTDFGVEPPAPTIGLGAIKTGDEVKLSFEWVVAKSAAAAK